MLAVNFMDRFLAVMPRQQKNRLQLIGTVCLLISSKFKETSPLPGERLIHYTDNSITPDEIRVSKFQFIELVHHIKQPILKLRIHRNEFADLKKLQICFIDKNNQTSNFVRKISICRFRVGYSI